MKLSQLKSYLNSTTELNFDFPDGRRVKPHAHLTELGLMYKKYLDCGGNLREDRFITMQLWEADDVDHRLSPNKFNDIISMTETSLQLDDLSIRVEYQADTVGIYQLRAAGDRLVLEPTFTDCQASDKCGIPVKKEKVLLGDLGVQNSVCCVPGSGCC